MTSSVISIIERAFTTRSTVPSGISCINQPGKIKKSAFSSKITGPRWTKYILVAPYRNLLLPSALLMAIGAELLAALVTVNLGFTTFLQ